MTTTSGVGSTGTTTGSTGTTAASSSQAASQDRFLTLLVAQLQNQDPLNPMDNAQVTTQMAQISTVDGIEKLNGTVGGLNSQLVQLQTLQGASLVGKEVVVAGNQLSANDAGLMQGAFELTSAADTVKVEVLNGAGLVIDSFDVGAESAGRHGFDWVPKAGVDAKQGETFRVTAKAGAATITSTALMRDTVDAVSTSGDTLSIELRRKGTVDYAAIKAFL